MTRSGSDNSLQFSLFDTTALCGLTLDAPPTASPAFTEIEPVADPEPIAPPRQTPPPNFRLQGERKLAGNWKDRAADNIAAIRLLHHIETDNRPATTDEQAILAKFTGFGASELANTLFRRAGESFRPGWHALGTELEQMVTPAELAGLARATQYAHYTPEFIVSAIWTALTSMGFAGGSILEPGCGTGLFFSLLPETLIGQVSLTGIEVDPITARIARLLFPDAWIRQEDFTRARLPETFNLAIGNPPFSNLTVRSDDPAGKLGLSLHDYFIARSVERLKPGGVAVFVTSRWTMDKVAPTARTHISAMADLIGAVRLPQGALNAAAGTEVVVDILLLRKRRPDETAGGPDWSNLAEVLPADDGEPAIGVNRYFGEHPENVLGRHTRTSSPYGPIYTCSPRPDLNLATALEQALDRITSGVRLTSEPVETPQGGRPTPPIFIGTAADGATIKEGSYVLTNGVLMQVINGMPLPVAIKSATVKEGIAAKHARIIRTLIPIRDTVRMVLRAQHANEPWGQAQARLRAAYLTFVRQFGPINHTTISTRVDEETGQAIETVRRPNLARSPTIRIAG